ncbi:MAG: DEAD/DEAH box helicase [Pseudomonadales bacterium]
MPDHRTSANVDLDAALAAFEPGVRDWFGSRFDAPTAAQAASWPIIASAEHLLVTAPTGSGKTLTAFLWALNEFAAGRWQPGATRVVYVSPLKALNNDIRRNLLEPLDALYQRGVLPSLRVQTRSGDTAAGERQRMLRRPPEILITTPESLHLLLTSERGRHALGTVRSVVLDEVHALVDNRRGTLLLTALERLTLLSGEFQRIALSATVRPIEAVAQFIAGRDASLRPRPIRTVSAAQEKRIDLRVRYPAAARTAADRGEPIWSPLADAFRERIRSNRSTLLFTNSRRLAEKLTQRINEDQPQPLAYAHHGSLAREIRLAVEERLKAGQLRAIVATSSLEMGIDIGALDEVLLVQSPPSIAATLQRIGRAGHQVGAVSRGSLYPTHPFDFVEAAALAGALAERDIEPMRLLRNPLDVLAQIIVSMSASETWPLDALYEVLQRSGSYETLPREQFDLVVEMLAGRYAGTRLRELKARVSLDRIHRNVHATHGALLAMYNAGGVIPDRGYFQLRHVDNGARLGELDEEFVWEATLGQIFTLGTQNWQIQRITHNDVLVRPTQAPATAPPFWRAEAQNRSHHFSRRIAAFLQRADALLSSDGRDALCALLEREHAFEATAAGELGAFLEDQRRHSGAPLPHAGHLLVERILAGPGGYRGAGDLQQLVLHTLWGGQLNLPWALALKAALVEAGIAPAQVHADDNCVVVQSREPLSADVVLSLVRPDELDRLLRGSLEGSGFFGARFREAAGRALLLTRQRFGERLPLWLSRLQSRQLLTQVRDFQEFPVLLEAWRSCLADEFDLPALRERLIALDDARLPWTEVECATPSPFAAGLSYGQISGYMYADDTPDPGTPSALSDDLIRGVSGDAALRPRLERAAIDAYLERRQRRAPGYQPDSEDDWLEWLKERVLLPGAEWPGAIEHPHAARLQRRAAVWLAHREVLHVLRESGLSDGATVSGPIPEVSDPRSAVQLALEVLSFHGPLSLQKLHELLPAVPEDLLQSGELLRGPLLADDDGDYLCERQSFEAILRLQRALRRPRLEPRSVRQLPGFLAAWQGLAAAGTAAGPPDLATALETLRGYAAPVAIWLDDLPAARCAGCTAEQLDGAVAALGLHWRGAGNGQIRLGYAEDLALQSGAEAADDSAEASIGALFADPTASYGFHQLADRQNRPLAEFNHLWWSAVWQGALSADSLQPLRQGQAGDFKLPGWDSNAPAMTSGQRPGARLRSGRRAGPQRRARGAARGWTGLWTLNSRPGPDDDPLAALEDAKELARILLDRYGIVCRELANRDGPGRWRDLFRALRVMELSGEVVTGYFFEGLSGPQFALSEAVSVLLGSSAGGSTRNPADPLTQPADGDSFWVNAMDPAAPCGLGLDWAELPARRPGNYLAFADGQLGAVVENRGRRLQLLVAPDDPRLGRLMGPIVHLLRQRGRVDLNTINGVAAADSDYLDALRRIACLRRDHKHCWLEPL